MYVKFIKKRVGEINILVTLQQLYKLKYHFISGPNYIDYISAKKLTYCYRQIMIQNIIIHWHNNKSVYINKIVITEHKSTYGLLWILTHVYFKYIFAKDESTPNILFIDWFD